MSPFVFDTLYKARYFYNILLAAWGIAAVEYEHKENTFTLQVSAQQSEFTYHSPGGSAELHSLGAAPLHL